MKALSQRKECKRLHRGIECKRLHIKKCSFYENVFMKTLSFEAHLTKKVNSKIELWVIM